VRLILTRIIALLSVSRETVDVAESLDSRGSDCEFRSRDIVEATALMRGVADRGVPDATAVMPSVTGRARRFSTSVLTAHSERHRGSALLVLFFGAGRSFLRYWRSFIGSGDFDFIRADDLTRRLEYGARKSWV
jgi:hypothetical protein